MADPVFPDIAVGEGSRRSVEHRVIKATFGDGYQQALPDGINTKIEVWSLKFSAYWASEIDTITDFLDLLQSSQHFLWTAPGETEVKKWRQVGNYSVDIDGPLTKSLSFNVERVYIL